ncbi:MAG: hypothetical protein G01um101444_449 [Parcubacteria group bacterium Gr01-1014_44]|nr:MAG: hypothetical protein G01um101444_449 [Parcubacteria group bacterium Gr01-1014_44]
MDFKGLSAENTEIVLEGKKFVATTILSEEFGYDRNHIALLARTGRVEGVRIAGNWLVSRESLEEYKKKAVIQKRLNGIKSTSSPFGANQTAPTLQSGQVPSTALFHTANRPINRTGRVYLKSFFKRGLRYALSVLFIFLLSFSLLAPEKYLDLRASSLQKFSTAKDFISLDFPILLYQNYRYTKDNFLNPLKSQVVLHSASLWSKLADWILDDEVSKTYVTVEEYEVLRLRIKNLEQSRPSGLTQQASPLPLPSVSRRRSEGGSSPFLTVKSRATVHRPPVLP